MTTTLTDAELCPPAFWTPLRKHATQSRFFYSNARFAVARAGRRSGKTELAKRKLIRIARNHHRWFDYPGRYFFSAPVHDQAREIFWDDLKAAIPPWEVLRVSETKSQVTLRTGTIVRCFGLDKPARIEGKPIDGIVVDEVDEMRSWKVWDVHVSPALDTPGRPGWAIFIGVPRGIILRDLARRALTDDDWESFHWTSEEILPADQIAAAKKRSDPRTYRTEYLASDETLEGQAYYTFDAAQHVERLPYVKGEPLVFCFDFNVDPGTAVVCQEQGYRGTDPAIQSPFTACLDEVFKEPDSRTSKVCRTLIHRWGEKHRGTVYIEGDATGGARKTAADGSDWDVIREHFKRVPNWQVRYRYPKANPSVRGRVNAMNTRLMNADEHVRLLIDPRCEHLIRDLEEVQLTDDGRGEPDKDRHPKMTHISDALGYYVARKFPVKVKPLAVSRL